METLDLFWVGSNPISFPAHFIQHFHRTQLSFDIKLESYRCVVELFEKTGENSSPLCLGVFEYWVEEAVEGGGEGVGLVPLADPPDHVAPVALAAQNKGTGIGHWLKSFPLSLLWKKSIDLLGINDPLIMRLLKTHVEDFSIDIGFYVKWLYRKRFNFLFFQ